MTLRRYRWYYGIIQCKTPRYRAMRKRAPTGVSRGFREKHETASSRYYFDDFLGIQGDPSVFMIFKESSKYRKITPWGP